MAIPNDYNIAAKHLEKIRKYTDLAIEIKSLWNLRKVEIVPMIIGATGTFYHKFDDYLKKMDLKDEFDKYLAQKIVLLGTAHIIRAFLQIA